MNFPQIILLLKFIRKLSKLKLDLTRQCFITQAHVKKQVCMDLWNSIWNNYRRHQKPLSPPLTHPLIVHKLGEHIAVCNIENIHVMLILCFTPNCSASYSGNITDFKLKFMKRLFKNCYVFTFFLCFRVVNANLFIMIANENIKKINQCFNLFFSFLIALSWKLRCCGSQI